MRLADKSGLANSALRYNREYCRENFIYLDISKPLGRSGHVAIIMGKSRCSDITTSCASCHR